MSAVLIDCDTCEVRDVACGDCVVSVLLGPTRLLADGDATSDGVAFAGALPAEAATPLGVYALADDEQAALAVLAESGLVPPLRLVSPGRGPGAPTGGPRDADAPESAEHAV